MPLSIFNNLTEEDKNSAIEKLVRNSGPSQDFLMLVILASVMATVGLLLGSASVIIGSMLIAPILYPILSIALGVIMSDAKLITRASTTTLKAMLYAVAAAAVITIFFTSRGIEVTDEILARTEPSLAYFVVAVVAGFAASFALVKPSMSETVPGIAISVALVPPLGVVGIGIAWADWFIVSSSFLLFVVNAVGIIFAAMINFSLMNFYVKRKIAQKTIAQNEAQEAKSSSL